MSKSLLKRLTCLLFFSALLFCIGCGESKLDTSSDQAFSSSLEKIYKSVPSAEQESFREYLNITMQGKVPISFYGGKRKVPSYEEFVKMYSLIKALGNEKDMKLFNDLNGLTKSEIIKNGKTILKNHLEEHLASLNKQIDELSKKTEEMKNFLEELQKVTISLSDKAEAAESDIQSHKGQIGFLTVDVTITNGSSKTIRGFTHDKVTFVDGNGKEVDSMNMASLSEFVAEDGSRPFMGGYSSPGIEAGKTLKGKITKKLGWLSPDFPYPPKTNIKAAFKEDTVKPILDGDMEMTGYAAQASIQKLEQLNKEKTLVESELKRI